MGAYRHRDVKASTGRETGGGSRENFSFSSQLKRKGKSPRAEKQKKKKKAPKGSKTGSKGDGQLLTLRVKEEEKR